MLVSLSVSSSKPNITNCSWINEHDTCWSVFEGGVRFVSSEFDCVCVCCVMLLFVAKKYTSWLLGNALLNGISWLSPSEDGRGDTCYLNFFHIFSGGYHEHT